MKKQCPQQEKARGRHTDKMLSPTGNQGNAEQNEDAHSSFGTDPAFAAAGRLWELRLRALSGALIGTASLECHLSTPEKFLNRARFCSTAWLPGSTPRESSKEGIPQRRTARGRLGEPWAS